MRSKLTLFLFVCIFGWSSEAFACKPFKSDIFTYGDLEKGTKIKVKLQGELWKAEGITMDDVPFVSKLWASPEVMSNFGDGKPRSEEKATQTLSTWTKRFAEGHPHGGLLVKNLQNEPIGYVVAGGGDDPGAAEVARCLSKDTWGKGIGTSLHKQIIQVWAPEVSKWGRDAQINPLIREKFCSFQSQPLSRLDVTASPRNVGSWKSIDRAGYKAAKANLQVIPVEDVDFIFDGKELKPDELEKEIISLFVENEDLKQGVRYPMVDPEGIVRTMSYHKAYGRVKYHFEHQVYPQ